MIVERHLLIDDIRTLNCDKIARTYEEGIAALQEEKWDVLWLDHDLGFMHYGKDYSDEKTGYDIMCWLEEHPEHLPGRIEIVSSNPVGRERIQRVKDKLYGNA